MSDGAQRITTAIPDLREWATTFYPPALSIVDRAEAEAAAGNIASALRVLMPIVVLIAHGLPPLTGVAYLFAFRLCIMREEIAGMFRPTMPETTTYSVPPAENHSGRWW